MLGLDATMNLFQGFALGIRPGLCFIRLSRLHVSIPVLLMPLRERLSLMINTYHIVLSQRKSMGLLLLNFYAAYTEFSLDNCV